jgi:NADPH-dependent ferric siderophore reductase
VIEKVDGKLRVTCEAHELRVHDAKDIFDLKERDRAKLEEVNMDGYLEDLALAFQADADIPDIRLWIHNASDLSDAVRQKALEYLEQVKKV